MFGRNKEAHQGTGQVIATLNPLRNIPMESLTNLPVPVITRFNEYNQLLEERKILNEQLRTLRMPKGQKEAHKDRRTELDAQINGVRNIAEALRLGYSLYVMSPNFYVGAVNHNEPDHREEKITDSRVGRESRNFAKINLVFKAPMPATVIQKYNEAEATRLFDKFLVGSADPSLFESVIVAPSLKADPILVGYIKTDVARIYESFLKWNLKEGKDDVLKGVNVGNATGFMIANWNLGIEVKAALK